MTIDDYIASEQRHCERELEEARKIGNLELFVRKQGALMELETIRAMLPKLEHDLTVKELHDFCEAETAKDPDGRCDECPLRYRVTGCDDITYWDCDIRECCPSDWNVSDIEKRLKEARND